MPLNDAELLVEVEALIEDLRWARGDPAVPEHRKWLALKQMARDIRARSTPPTRAVDAVIFQVQSGMKARTRLGFIDPGHHQAISEAVIAHWPTIRLALERLQETASV